MRGVKPDATMKILSGTFTFKLALLIAVVALGAVAIRAFAQGSTARPVPSDRKLTLKLKDAQLKDATGNTFKGAMRALKGEQFSIRMTHNDGSTEEILPSAGASIKTDKVMKSELAKSPDGEFTAIGTHVTQTVTSDTKAEIQNVLDTLN